ncbi:MAG: hypothetical protein ACREAR_03925, partial [Nitrosotalea sp.]
SKLGFVAITLLVLIVIGLGANGTLSALDNGYNKLASNPTVQKLESQAVTKVVSLQPDVHNLLDQATAKITSER